MMGFPMFSRRNDGFSNVSRPIFTENNQISTCEVDDFNIKVAAAEEAVGN
jgi:hypothetical protein